MKFETERRPMKDFCSASVAGPRPKIWKMWRFIPSAAGRARAHKEVSSVDLTAMYLERLKRYDPLLKFVITLTAIAPWDRPKTPTAKLQQGSIVGRCMDCPGVPKTCWR